MEEGNLITNCGNVKVDHILNDTKAKVLLTMKLLWGYFFKKKPKALYSAGNVYF